MHVKLSSFCSKLLENFNLYFLFDMFVFLLITFRIASLMRIKNLTLSFSMKDY